MIEKQAATTKSDPIIIEQAGMRMTVAHRQGLGGTDEGLTFDITTVGSGDEGKRILRFDCFCGADPRATGLWICTPYDSLPSNGPVRPNWTNTKRKQHQAFVVGFFLKPCDENKIIKAWDAVCAFRVCAARQSERG